MNSINTSKVYRTIDEQLQTINLLGRRMSICLAETEYSPANTESELIKYKQTNRKKLISHPNALCIS